MSSLKLVCDAAIRAAFPQCAAASAGSELETLCAAVITRCGNPAFGDFQCNNAMALSKALKGLQGYSGRKCLRARCVLRVLCMREGRGSDYSYQLR
jgi:hypothetical protein